MVKNMDLEYSTIQMVASTLDRGAMEAGMDRAYLLPQKAKNIVEG